MQAHIVFRKTSGGVDEVVNHTHGLSFISRRILMLIDGVRSAQALSGFVRPGEIEGVLQELLQLDLIQANAPSMPHADGPEGLSPELQMQTHANHLIELGDPRAILAGPIHPSRLAEFKRVAMRELNELLGPAASNWISDIEGCRSVDAFRGLLLQIEQHLRDVRGAKEAEKFIKRIAAILY